MEYLKLNNTIVCIEEIECLQMDSALHIVHILFKNGDVGKATGVTKEEFEKVWDEDLGNR